MQGRTRMLKIGFACALLASVSCSEKDAKKVSKVGNKALDKASEVAGQAGQQIALSIGNAKAAIDGLELTGRVHYRLKWDQQLEGAEVKVQADKGVITLMGTIRNEAQRRRAMDLARNTTGVEAVTDSMQLVAP